jgi:hypothetical protein
VVCEITDRLVELKRLRKARHRRRTLVVVLVDRVLVDAPDVEIRYVITLTGLARRNGVLRPCH